MKNIKTILIALVAAAIGLGAGYVLFHKETDKQGVENQSPVTNHQSPTIEHTCSMHPQIRQNEMGICPICEMDLTPVGGNQS